MGVRRGAGTRACRLDTRVETCGINSLNAAKDVFANGRRPRMGTLAAQEGYDIWHWPTGRCTPEPRRSGEPSVAACFRLAKASPSLPWGSSRSDKHLTNGGSPGPEQPIRRDRHHHRDDGQNRRHDPWTPNRRHYCGLTAIEVPKLLVSFTITEITFAAFPETVNGMVSLNWLPNALELEFWYHVEKAEPSCT